MIDASIGKTWIRESIETPGYEMGGAEGGWVAGGPNNLIIGYWAKILPQLGFTGQIYYTVTEFPGTLDETSHTYMTSQAKNEIAKFEAQGYQIVRNPLRTMAGSKNITEYGLRIPTGEIVATWEYVAGTFLQQIAPLLTIAFPAILSIGGTALGVAASNTAIGVTVSDVIGAIGSEITGQAATAVVSQATGSAVVGAASAIVSGGDAESVIKGALIGAAGGVAKPYIADAIGYVESLLPDQVADLASIDQLAESAALASEIAPATVSESLSYALADSAALASEIAPATVSESLSYALAEQQERIMEAIAWDEVTSPPTSPIERVAQIWTEDDFRTLWDSSVKRQTSPFARFFRDSWRKPAGGFFTGGSYESAEDFGIELQQQADLAGPILPDQVAFPTSATVSPIQAAEIAPIRDSTSITSTELESIGSDVTNIGIDDDWLFGYSDPVADFANAGNEFVQDPTGDFFEFVNVEDLTGLEAGYIPTTEEVASNVGYVESGSFGTGAGAQGTFDTIIKNVTVAAATALTLVRAWREIEGPAPNTTAQARVGGSIVRANADGTITTTNAAGQVIRTLPPAGQPQMATDGSMIVNNGDGSYTRITPDGRTTVQRYGTTPAGSGGIAGISTPLLIGAGALLVFAVAGGRRA